MWSEAFHFALKLVRPLGPIWSAAKTPLRKLFSRQQKQVICIEVERTVRDKITVELTGKKTSLDITDLLSDERGEKLKQLVKSLSDDRH